MILKSKLESVTFSLELELHFKSKTGKCELHGEYGLGAVVGSRMGSIQGIKISCCNCLKTGIGTLHVKTGNIVRINI